MQADRFQACRRITFNPHGKQLDLGSLLAESPDYFLHMDGAAFAAKDRNTQVGTQVGDTHHAISWTAVCASLSRSFGLCSGTEIPSREGTPSAPARNIARRCSVLRRMSNSASIRSRPRAANRERR